MMVFNRHLRLFKKIQILLRKINIYIDNQIKVGRISCLQLKQKIYDYCKQVSCTVFSSQQGKLTNGVYYNTPYKNSAFSLV